MRYAIVTCGVVSNIGIADHPWAENWVCIEGLDPMPGIGWTYANGVFAEA